MVCFHGVKSSNMVGEKNVKMMMLGFPIGSVDIGINSWDYTQFDTYNCGVDICAHKHYGLSATFDVIARLPDHSW